MLQDETLANLRKICWKNPVFKVDYPNSIVESLKGNAPPSTIVASVAREFRETSAKAVVATEEEIASLDAQILTLQTRRNALIEKASPEWMKVHACNAILSVVRCLPMEIIQEIALHARPLQPWPTRRDSPISLSHVCKGWRNATLSMPRLWSEMYLEVDVNYTTLQRILSAVNEWFPRAKSCPLSLHLYINDDGEVKGHDMQHFVIKFPNLEVLTLKCTASDHQQTVIDGDPAALFEFLRFAENLRHLVLDRPIPGVGIILTAFSWSALTSLTVTQEMSLVAWRNLIFICQALKMGTFHLSGNDPVDQSGPIICQDVLEDLHLIIMDSDMKYFDFAYVCSFTNLKVLQIDRFGFTQTTPIHDVNPPASVQLKKLTALALSGFRRVEITFLDSVLRAASSVTRLRIDLISSALPFKLLTHLDASKPDILPHLQTLSTSLQFSWMSPELEDVVEGEIKPMLHSRTSQALPSSQRLQEFSVSLSPFHPDMATATRLFEMLEPFSEQGLKVCCRGGTEFMRDASIDNWHGGIEHRASRRAFAKAQRVEPPILEAPPIGRW
ncbi:hypothetical protein NLJ89_g6959 [Agrocybe chaxingu]|uniref:F-box domain-containing protein n=1 Tax=Agrocybe chaxingu TaxID=84603 RepID=A0A9W8JY49_9AGAR|nr:hypothetical protein NLJ89_g6959 [Agrocybe chaxingu]